MPVPAGYQSLQALERYYVIEYLHLKKKRGGGGAGEGEHAQEIKPSIVFSDLSSTLLKDSMTQFISRRLFIRNLS